MRFFLGFLGHTGGIQCVTLGPVQGESGIQLPHLWQFLQHDPELAGNEGMGYSLKNSGIETDEKSPF